IESGHSLLVIGEPGVGKTQLVESVLSQGLPPSVGPVLTVPGAIADDAPLATVYPRLAALLERCGPMDGRPTPVGPRPVLRVEDGHRLDIGLAHALARLAREGTAQVIATLHPAAASRSPWVELWRDGVAERLDVPTLSPAEIEELTVAVLGGPATTDTYDRIVARCGGNAFFLRELLRVELEAGTLVEQRGVWLGPVALPPDDRVVDVVRRSLGRLDAAAREAFDLVAHAGPLPVGAVPSIVDAATLARLVDDRLVVIEQGPGPEAAAEPMIRVHHPMVAEAARILVPLDRRRRLYLALRGRAPGRCPSDSPAGLVRRVLWALDVGIAEDVTLLTAAVDAALLRHLWQDAIRIARAARGRLEPTDPARAELLMLRAAAWQWLDEPGHAVADLAAVRRLLAGMERGPHHDALAVQLADQVVGLARLQVGDIDIALTELRRTRDALDDGLAPEHRLALRISWLAHLGAAGRSQESLAPSLDLLRGTVAGPELLPLVMPVTYGLGLTGRLDTARTISRQGATLAMATPDSRHPWLVDDIVISHALVLLWSGEVEGFADLVDGRNGPRGYSEHEVFVQVGRGLLAGAHGRWTDAHRELEGAVARYAALDVSGISAYATAVAAVAAAASGAAGRARELIAAVAQSPRRASVVVEPDLRLHLLDAGAWLREPTHLADAVALARWSRDRGLHRTELEALHRTVVAAGRRPVRIDAGGNGAAISGTVMGRIRALAGAVSGRRAAALVAHAEAIASEDHQLALARTQELGRLGLWLPGRVWGAGLTRREREIAGLAAGGLSSREIAGRFTLSVRTVDTHLSHVFAKLGVHNRRDLAEALRG
ncbi:LuxR C-terminal-related transcriptional regulator, partial [Georgenia sp.]